MRMMVRMRVPAMGSKLRRMRQGREHGIDRRRVLQPVESAWTDAAPAPESILDYWNILLAHWKTLLLAALAGVVAAVVIGLAQTPQYRARTSLEIQSLNDNFLDLNRVVPTVPGMDLPTGPSYLQTQVVMLQSDTLLERVIDRLNLQESRPVRLPEVRRMLGLSDSPRVLTGEELTRQAKKNLTVRTARDTRVVEVLYESPNPKVAADFVNTLASEFIGQSQEMRLQAFQRIAERLTSHLSEMKTSLEHAEEQLQDYVRTAGLTFTSEKDNVADVRLVELQGELARAQADRIAKQTRFEQARNTSADSLPEVLDDPTLREYGLRLTELRRQLVELTATLTPAHYKVRRVQAQIDELQGAADRQRTLTLRRIGGEYTAALRRQQVLAEAHAGQQKIVTDQSGKAIRYRTLRGEVDSTRQLYETMLERVKQAELATTMRASNVLIVDAARIPARPYSPVLPMNAAVGLFGGVFVGLGFVLFRERVDRRIQVPGEARVYLDVAELGVVTATDATPRQLGKAATRSGSILFGHAGGNDSFAPVPVSGDGEVPMLADCYTSIVTSLLLASGGEDMAQVIVVTSPCAGDGKTTIACNLSLATAETGKKVLLIDGDLRRPQLHRFFRLQNTKGLSDLLRADMPTGEGVSDTPCVCETRIPGLHVLTAGAGTPRGARVLQSARMTALLERLRSEFEMVIVDTPPVIPVPDARVLGRLADGVILVLRAGHTTIESALAARQRFAEDGTRVLGTILNGWNPNAGRRYGHAGYYAAYES